MQDFKKLVVWQKAHQLTLNVYKLTRGYPSEEKFGLISQMQRSSSSIPTNIAEGCGRETNAELNRFLYVALGSASELHYQIILSHDLGYVEQSHFLVLEQEIIQVKKMLSALIKKLKTDN
ncbi:MAG: four helix bundle protein [Anaerolineae bacterium]|nr:four helix bundle protein [Anaerolineae bacterium]